MFDGNSDQFGMDKDYNVSISSMGDGFDQNLPLGRTSKCTATDSEENPWWKVSLGASWNIVAVRLQAHPSEEMGVLDIYIGGRKCQQNAQVSAGQTKAFPCVGRGSEIEVVRRTTKPTALKLCGVQAYGNQVSS